MTQSSKSRPEQIFYEENGEVGLKVSLSRTNQDLQPVSEPPKSWRSSFRKFRKNLSRPETQVRIFLSIILFVGVVLLIGYAANEVMFESGANRSLKKHGTAKNAANENSNIISGKLSRKEPSYSLTHTMKTTYDSDTEIITRGKDQFKITDQTTWIKGTEKKQSRDEKKKPGTYYDVFMNVLNVKKNKKETMHLKVPEKSKDQRQDGALMDAIRKNDTKKEIKIVKYRLNDRDYNEGFQKHINQKSFQQLNGGAVKVYNKQLYSELLIEEKERARGTINGKESIKIDGQFPEFSIVVPGIQNAAEVTFVFHFMTDMGTTLWHLSVTAKVVENVQ